MQDNAKFLTNLIEKHGSIRAAGRASGIPESTIRMRLKRYAEGEKETPIPKYAFVPEEDELPPSHIEESGVPVKDYSSPGRVHRYIFTSAQNNCRVHRGFLNNLEAFAKHFDASIVVGMTLYDRAGYSGILRNGKAIKQGDVWWDKAVRDYIEPSRVKLTNDLHFCGELDILATVKNPLSGLESYCKNSSIIVSHNRYSMKCVENRKGAKPKRMYTTGSITEKRFIQRKTGQVAAFHHIIGALFVEIDADGTWYTHHLNADDDGSFYWLDYRVSNGKVKKHGERLEGLILGDVHHEKLEEEQSKIAMEIVRKFKPKHTFVHDLIDFTSRNHHTIHDPFFRMSVRNINVRQELESAASWLRQLAEQPTDNVVVVKSNHDLALTKWLRETDWRTDPINARIYLELANIAVQCIEAGTKFDPVEYAMRSFAEYPPELAKKVQFLELDESYEVCGIECGMHGHVGPSGTRGSPEKFAKLGFKSFTGHTHTPSITDGSYVVGVMGNLDMTYNIGPSRWVHAHGIIYPNGKRAFLMIENGKYRV